MLNRFSIATKIWLMAVIIFGLTIVSLIGGSLLMKDIAKGEGDLIKRIEVSSSDEIGDLADGFN